MASLPQLLLLLIAGALFCFVGQQLATRHLFSPQLARLRGQAMRAAVALRDEHPMSGTSTTSPSPPLFRRMHPSWNVSAASKSLSQLVSPGGPAESVSLPPPPPKEGKLLSQELALPFRRLGRPAAELVGASASTCTHRRPYHVLLTAASGVYQEWQTRIAYYHYRKVKAMHPCSDMGGFTRLLNTRNAMPDGLMSEIPTVRSSPLIREFAPACSLLCAGAREAAGTWRL